MHRAAPPCPIEPPPSRGAARPRRRPTTTASSASAADLEPGTLLAAYRAGLFPMPYGRRRIAWFSPDPRGIIPLDGLRVSRSLRRSVRRFDVRTRHRVRRGDGRAAPTRAGPAAGSTPPFVDAYTRLHELGWAHSVECVRRRRRARRRPLRRAHRRPVRRRVDVPPRDRRLQGRARRHSSTGSATTGGELLDVQWTTPHLASLGAVADPDRDRASLRAPAADACGLAADGTGAR